MKYSFIDLLINGTKSQSLEIPISNYKITPQLLEIDLYSENLELQEQFSSISTELTTNEAIIINELNAAQGSSINIEGYYQPKTDITENAMRPSVTFNSVINNI